MRPHRAFVLFLLLAAALLGADKKLKIYTLPEEAKPALKQMLHRIDSAKYRIDAAIYSFTHKAIAKRLAKAARRGVKIRVVFDRESNIRNIPARRKKGKKRKERVDAHETDGYRQHSPDLRFGELDLLRFRPQPRDCRLRQRLRESGKNRTRFRKDALESDPLLKPLHQNSHRRKELVFENKHHRAQNGDPDRHGEGDLYRKTHHKKVELRHRFHQHTEYDIG